MWNINRPDPIMVDTPKKLRKLKQLLEHKLIAGFDTETTGLDIARDELLFWGLSTGRDRYCLDRAALAAFAQIFRDPRRVWVGTNTKFDVHMLANSGVPGLAGEWIDTVVMDALYDSDARHGLKESYHREFDEDVADFREVFYPRNKKGVPTKPKGEETRDSIMRVWNDNPADVIEYASLDPWMSYRLYKRLRRYLEETITWRGESLWDVYLRFEMPFTKVLYRMERRGLQIDTDYLIDCVPEAEKERRAIAAELCKLNGALLNPSSPKQLIELFINQMELPVIKTTKSGSPSMDESVLQVYTDGGNEIARLVLEHRKISKLLGTYINSWISLVDNDARLHGSYNQAGTETGRLSSSDPNLQNIPRLGSRINLRTAIISAPGYGFWCSDYDQLEMVLAGHFSGDPRMLENIRNGRDIHCGNTALVYDLEYEEVTQAHKTPAKERTARQSELADKRQKTKGTGFGINYGEGPTKLARGLGLDKALAKKHPNWDENKVRWTARDEAQALIDKYFQQIPGMHDFIKATHRNAAEHKFVETLVGRRRYMRQIMDLDEQAAHLRDARREARARNRDPRRALCWCSQCKASRSGERKSVNSIIQGSAADIMQMAMILIDQDPDLSDAHLVLQVHDEVGAEVPEHDYKPYADRMRQHMLTPAKAFDLQVPLSADYNVAYTWADAK